ncbi:aldehyde dehydrogenase family protein [Porticoccaceae bacterium]|nr:aldehyde dehydrogenase family protein [Porticoccaceae bacterium]
MSDINWHDRVKSTTFSVRNLINGEFSEPQGAKISKFAPHDGTLLYEFGEGTAAEVDLAVAAARESFNDGRWRNKSVGERQAILNKLADLLQENSEELGLYECLDVGKPIMYGVHDDVCSRATGGLRGAASELDSLLLPSGVSGNDMAYQYRKPIGVVGGIIGWNYPLALATGKTGPALAMGNSLVLKPSEFTSLSAIRMAELALEAGVPPGVLNVVHGSGATVGAAMSEHMDIDMLTFTGSSATGKTIMAAAGNSNMKRVHLECGGKSANIIFDDCDSDLDAVAASVVGMAFPNQGALCITGSRLMVQDSIKDALMEKVLEHTAKIKPQDPLDASTEFGAIMNAAHMNKILGYIESGKSEGATLLCGGNQVNVESGGYFIEPTIFDNVTMDHRIAKEEIFGPVLSVFSFKDEAEAVALANDTRFALAAHVSTTGLGRAHRMGQQLDAGLIMISGSSNPISGFVNLGVEPQKESGMGFEGGRGGMEAYSVVSAVHMFI